MKQKLLCILRIILVHIVQLLKCYEAHYMNNLCTINLINFTFSVSSDEIDVSEGENLKDVEAEVSAMASSSLEDTCVDPNDCSDPMMNQKVSSYQGNYQSNFKFL